MKYQDLSEFDKGKFAIIIEIYKAVRDLKTDEEKDKASLLIITAHATKLFETLGGDIESLR